MRPIVCVLVLLAAALPAVVADSELPPMDLVQNLRRARIALLEGDEATGLQLLREASEAHPDRLAPVVSLLGYERRYSLPAEEAGKLRSMLTEHLADPARPIPPGALGYLITDPDADAEELLLVLEAASRRVEASAPEAGLLRTMLHLNERLQRPAQAREVLELLLQLEPTVELRWQAVRFDRKLERWDRAAEQLEVLLGQDPDPYTRMSYIEALSKLGSYETLVEQLGLLPSREELADVSLRQLVHQLLLQVAWDLRDREMTAEAEAIFRRLLATDAGNREARAAILYLYSTEEERRAHEAELASQWAGEENADALLEQGSKLLAGGDAAGAIDLLRRSAHALPDSEIAWYNLGLAALTLELWGEAEAAHARTAEINPRRGEAFLNRGMALHKLERCPEAIRALDHALELQAELTQAHYYLYACHHALGHTDDARRHLELYQATN